MISTVEGAIVCNYYREWLTALVAFVCTSFTSIVCVANAVMKLEILYTYCLNVVTA